jgi:uncharacterized protein YbjT (DUF2867 family)
MTERRERSYYWPAATTPASRWECAASTPAAAAGVARIVKTLRARRGDRARSQFADAHGASSSHLRASGISTTSLLRGRINMINLLARATASAQAGAVFLPAAGAVVAMIDRGTWLASRRSC